MNRSWIWLFEWIKRMLAFFFFFIYWNSHMLNFIWKETKSTVPSLNALISIPQTVGRTIPEILNFFPAYPHIKKKIKSTRPHTRFNSIGTVCAGACFLIWTALGSLFLNCWTSYHENPCIACFDCSSVLFYSNTWCYIILH